MARAHTRLPNAASDSLFIANSSLGLSDIKQIGNDYNRNRIAPAKSFSAGGQMSISSEMKSKLKALADDSDLPDNARRAVHECLAR